MFHSGYNWLEHWLEHGWNIGNDTNDTAHGVVLEVLNNPILGLGLRLLKGGVVMLSLAKTIITIIVTTIVTTIVKPISVSW